MAVVRAEQFSCSSRSLICAAGVRLGLYSTNWTYPNGVSSHKRGWHSRKIEFCLIHCSFEPSVSIPALLFFFPLQNAFFFFKKASLYWRFIIPSYFMHTERAGGRVLLKAKVVIGGSSPFSFPALGCFLMCSGLEVRTSSSSPVNIWNRAAILNPKGGFESGSSLPYATTLRQICIFSLFVIWGALRVLSSFDERPFGVRFCFSVLVFPGSESAERKSGLMCASFPAKWSVWEND